MRDQSRAEADVPTGVSDTPRPIQIVVAICKMAGISFVCVLCFLACALISDHDVQNAINSPEHHDSVLQGPFLGSAGEPISAEVSHDFDGDGVEDELSCEYYHMEPLFSQSTSGMLYVRSGRTGEVLLAHATLTPISCGDWCGDVDQNGTGDVLVVERHAKTLLRYSTH